MSLETFAKELCEKLKGGRALNSRGYDPVYYVVYEPERTREAMAFERSLRPRLESSGFTVFEFNAYRELWALLEADSDWEEIESYDSGDPEQWEEIQVTLSEIAKGSGDGAPEKSLASRLRARIEEAAGAERPVVLVTGLHALHGFMRPGVLEGKLNGAFLCPAVFFYPGKTEGRDGLEFLGFYSTDGNYRSEHLVLPGED